MAPESAADLVVVNLRMVNNRLEAKVERFERSEKARKTGDLIEVLWNANAAPRDFSAGGDGVVYVSPKAKTPPLDYDATPSAINGGYEWSYNTQSDLMMVLVFPAGYIPIKCEPYPAKATVFKGDRVAAYWMFDEKSRAEVRWTMKKNEGDISRHVGRINKQTTLTSTSGHKSINVYDTNAPSEGSHTAAWALGGVTLLYLMGLIFFGPKDLSVDYKPIVRLIGAIAAGLLSYFFVGRLHLEGYVPQLKDVHVAAVGGTAVFVLVMLLWSY